jgi:hypothetical protein
MKAVADTLAVARSNLVERVARPTKPRRGYRKVADGPLLVLIRRPDLRIPAHHALGEPAAKG